jgi:hypothetical protein
MDRRRQTYLAPRNKIVSKQKVVACAQETISSRVSKTGFQLKVRSAKKTTYNIRDSPVVTHPSTSLTVTGLSMGERTGSRVFQYLWPYVAGGGLQIVYASQESSGGSDDASTIIMECLDSYRRF